MGKLEQILASRVVHAVGDDEARIPNTVSSFVDAENIQNAMRRHELRANVERLARELFNAKKFK